MPAEGFEALLEAKKERHGADRRGAGWEALRELVREYKALVETRRTATSDDPRAQLRAAIAAVFDSWRTPRAVAYRKVHGIPNDLGTAVSIVTMVFGNLGEDSATGVAFTRDPATGEKRFYGEFLMNAQGEDVVAGTRDPLPIEEMVELLPDAYAELLEIQERLERHYRDMLDLEFTVERGVVHAPGPARASAGGGGARSRPRWSARVSSARPKRCAGSSRSNGVSSCTVRSTCRPTRP